MIDYETGVVLLCKLPLIIEQACFSLLLGFFFKTSIFTMTFYIGKNKMADIGLNPKK